MCSSRARGRGEVQQKDRNRKTWEVESVGWAASCSSHVWSWEFEHPRHVIAICSSSVKQHCQSANKLFCILIFGSLPINSEIKFRKLIGCITFWKCKALKSMSTCIVSALPRFSPAISDSLAFVVWWGCCFAGCRKSSVLSNYVNVVGCAFFFFCLSLNNSGLSPEDGDQKRKTARSNQQQWGKTDASVDVSSTKDDCNMKLIHQ